MKKILRTGLLAILFLVPVICAAQEKKGGFNVSTDIYSNYVWRGSRFGSGPHIQPSVSYTVGGFTAGVWGSFNAAGYSEADPYLNYAFPIGLSFGVTDYYYPGLGLYDVTTESGSHAIEINGGFAKGGFSFNANYIINEAGGAGSAGNDTYLQAGYDFTIVNIFAGAGNGWYTSNGKFNLCNLGVGTRKVIAITDRFSIPLTGQVIVNPESERLYIVAGISF